MNNIKISSESSFKICHNLPEIIGTFKLIKQESDEHFLDNGSGFATAAYFSDAENTLVIVFKGTDDVLDYLTDAQLAVAGYSNQDRQALSFAVRIAKQLRAAGKKEFRSIARWQKELNGKNPSPYVGAPAPGNPPAITDDVAYPAATAIRPHTGMLTQPPPEP